MIREIWAPSLVEILPPSVLKDPRMKASAEALDLELKRLSQSTREALFLPRLDELSHQILDQLADQYHVDFFEPTEMDLETKRKLIRNSILDHRIKGTPAAVMNLLNKITSGAEIQEWYEYGGRPYYFRVTLKGLLDYGDNGETFVRMIEATKNARSWLDDIVFDLSKGHPDTTLSVGLIDLQQGNVDLDLNTRTANNQRFAVIQSDIVSGGQSIGIAREAKSVNRQSVRAGVVELISGNVTFGVDMSEPDEFSVADFERYIRDRWHNFASNPVIKYYKHNNHGDEGEIDDPGNPGDDETFPVDVDFLRLYWKFPYTNKKGEPRYHVRYQTIYNPREDITGREVKAVGAIGAAGGVFIYRKDDPIVTSGIVRSLYIRKTTTRII